MRTIQISATILFLSFLSITLNGQTDQFGKPVAAPLTATNAEVTVSNQTIQTLGLFEVLGTKEIGIVVKDTLKIRPKVPGTWTVDAKGVATFMTFTDFIVAPGTRGVILKDGVVKNGNTVSEFRVCVHPVGQEYLYFTFTASADGNFRVNSTDITFGKYGYTVINRSVVAIPYKKETAPTAIAPGRPN